MILSFETDRAQLEKYIPEEFELTTPEIQVAFNQLTEINWLAGGQYNLIIVTAPVRFHRKVGSPRRGVSSGGLGEQNGTYSHRTRTDRDS